MAPEDSAPAETTASRRGMLARVWDWARWPVAAGIIFWLIWSHREQFSELRGDEIRWDVLVLGFFVLTAGIITTFWRWTILVAALGFDFKLRDGLRLGFLGYLLNLVGPGSGGGDLVKAVMVAREQSDRKTAAVLTILVDRLIGVIALLIVGLVFCLVWWHGMPSAKGFATFVTAFAIGASIGVALFALVLSPALRRWKWLDKVRKVKWIGPILLDIVEAGRAYSKQHRVLWIALGMSFIGHLLVNTGFFLAGAALCGYSAIPSWVEHFQFMPAAQLFAGLFPTPGGVGGLEMAVMYSYQLAEMPRANGLLAAVGYRVMTVVLATIGGVYYFANRKAVLSAEAEAETLLDQPVSLDDDPQTASDPIATRRAENVTDASLHPTESDLFANDSGR